jgi:hypothetical protein
MSMPRRTIRRLAVWLMLTLLSAQWAIASYACPRVGPLAPRTETPQMRCHERAPQSAPDPAQALLCKAHSDQGSQSVNDAPAQQPSPQFVLWAVLDWDAPTLRAAHGSSLTDVETSCASPPGSPPLYLRLQVLRD